MATQKSDDVGDGRKVKDMKELKFEPVLNVNEQVKMSGNKFYKCSVDSELGLLGMNVSDGGEQFFCVDMTTNKTIFAQELSGEDPTHAHHWFRIDEQRYLAATSNVTFSCDEQRYCAACVLS